MNEQAKAPPQDKTPGWSTHLLSKLCPCVRIRWSGLVSAVPFALTLIETMRDFERQRYYKRIGVSRTLKSLHLPQPPHGLSLAFDCCPSEYLRTKRWNPGGVLWEALHARASDFGLLWGGNWLGWKDRPHFYLEACRCRAAMSDHKDVEAVRP